MTSFEPRYYEMAREEGDWSSFPRSKVLEYLRANLKVGSSVLEVGCGTAEILSFLPSGVSYYGLERSDYAVRGAKEKWAGIFPDATFLVGEAENLPFSEARFDTVLLLFVIEHVFHPRQVLAECVRVLKRGGSLVILAPNLEFPFSRPSALRHRSAFWRIGFVALRMLDYFLRIFGIFTFRIVKENFTDATGRYEKKDDDLRYLASSYEVIRELESLGMRLEKFWEAGKLSGFRRFLRYFPKLHWYGVTLAAALVKS
ncbi:MAG: methyltransferase domain-containing protein [Candidatus Sungiibacteriota bacterium]|uniref:Methyltransferase domain-containing protein n=1 Tax=Candidatus Sungiibacteriota bacterium TaxID=2750080 RepID=A0A7T5RKN8_9BACT|nr:MAG: methyltransferase domain-containing protein [Candidatus Sungbacteria bacterium]